MHFIREYNRCESTTLETLLQNIAKKEKKNILDFVADKEIRQYKLGSHSIYFDVRELPYDNVGLFAKRDCDTEWHFVNKMDGKWNYWRGESKKSWIVSTVLSVVFTGFIQ